MELPGSDREETQDAQRLGELLGKDSEDLTHEERFLPADVCGMRLR